MQKNKKPRVVLVDVIAPDTSKTEAEKRLEELESLVNTYGGLVVVTKIQKRGLPDYKTFIGKGKVNEILEDAKEKKIDLVILNNIVKPGQIFNLSEIFRKEKVEVWDRVDLILKIFEKHAKSTQAKLQIELAQLRHMGPRIIGLGSELMQQKGVKGMRGGPGETNIEIMKRHLRKQEQKIMEKLKHYEVIDEGHRKRRRRNNFKTVALVGYTNAGKSSLLNALTGKKVYIADELFATLDTRVSKLYLPQSNCEVLLSDTIGFIQDLPPELIKAFKSTLAETIEADLILHVIDISDPDMTKKIEVVEDILDQLKLHDRPKIYVFNKIDMVVFSKKKPKKTEDDVPPRIEGVLRAGKETAELLGWLDEEISEEDRLNKGNIRKNYKKFTPVFVSAYEGTNLDELKQKIATFIDSTTP